MSEIEENFKCAICEGPVSLQEVKGNGSSAIREEEYKCENCGQMMTRRSDKRSDAEQLVGMVRV